VMLKRGSRKAGAPNGWRKVERQVMVDAREMGPSVVFDWLI
jgi:hypothetical protein